MAVIPNIEQFTPEIPDTRSKRGDNMNWLFRNEKMCNLYKMF